MTSRFIRIAKFLYRPFALNGLDLRKLGKAAVNIFRFAGQVRAYGRAAGGERRFPLKFQNLYPCLSEYGEAGGTANGHYFHQDLLVARKIFARRPERHVDIGSRIDGFIAHLLCFMPVEVVDIRDVESKVAGLSFVRADGTDLANYPSGSVDSLSSLHAAEHFGLGRYGDPVDPAACFRFMASLERVLAPGGRLYFAVPVGRERVEFNAHRVFAPQTVLDSFPNLTLLSFSAVMDDGDLYADNPLALAASAEFGCGIFEFTKA
jgi:hypothetical protein